jgi:hypothetical protein
MIFCCNKMKQQSLEISKDIQEKNHTIIYDQVWRRYLISFFYYDSDAAGDMACEILFCPWCGTKLPIELSDNWLEILEKEFGIIDPTCDHQNLISPEFKTDEWWKKRGL